MSNIWPMLMNFWNYDLEIDHVEKSINDNHDILQKLCVCILPTFAGVHRVEVFDINTGEYVSYIPTCSSFF